MATCNRADYSKLAPVIGALQADSAFELSIIVSGSHLLDDYGLTFRMLIEDGFNPDARLHTIVRGVWSHFTTRVGYELGRGAKLQCFA